MRTTHPGDDVAPVVIVLDERRGAPAGVDAGVLVGNADLGHAERNVRGITRAALHTDLTVAEFVQQPGREDVQPARLVRARVVVVDAVEAATAADLLGIEVDLVEVEVEPIVAVAQIVIDAPAVLDRIPERARFEPSLGDHRQTARDVVRRGGAAGTAEHVGGGPGDARCFDALERVVSQETGADAVRVGSTCVVHELGRLERDDRSRLRDSRSQRLNRPEEEGPVLSDRASERRRHVMAAERLVLRREQGARPQLLVREEVTAGPAIVVAARLGGDGDLHRTAPAVLHAERVRLDGDFLHRVRIGREVRRPLEDVARDVQAVQRELVAALVPAIAARLDGLLRGEVVGRVRWGSAADGAMAGDARSQGDQAKEVATLQRQFLQCLRSDGGLHPRFRRVEDFRVRPHHGHLLAGTCDGEGQVHAGGLRGLQPHLRSGGLEPGDFREHLIPAGRQAAQLVHARLVRDRTDGHLCFEVARSDRHAGHDRTTLIRDDTLHAGAELRRGGRAR